MHRANCESSQKEVNWEESESVSEIIKKRVSEHLMMKRVSEYLMMKRVSEYLIMKRVSDYHPRTV